MHRVSLALVAALALAVACNGNVSASPTPDQPPDAGVDGAGLHDSGNSPAPDAGGAGDIVDSAVPPATPGPPSFCGAVPGQWQTFATEADVMARIARRWILCGEGIAALVPGQAGLELGSDRSFKILVKDPNGALVPTTSPDGFGTFTLVQGPIAQQPNEGSTFQFEFDAQSGAQYTQLMAIITESPRTMLMTPLGTRLIGYVPEDVAGWPEVEVPQPTKGAAQPPPAACVDEAGSTADAATSSDGDAAAVSSAIEGDWLLCSGTPLGLRTDYAGIRFNADGRYESLVWDANGTLAVATDLFDSGDYQVGPDHGAGLEGLTIHYGLIHGNSLDIDTAQLPNRLALVNSGGNGKWAFVRRSITGE